MKERTRCYGRRRMVPGVIPLLALALSASAAPQARPGPVVVDIRARVAAGYGFGRVLAIAVEPDVLILSDNGGGLGIDASAGVVACSASPGPGGYLVAAIGLKYAGMRWVGDGPLLVKYGAGGGPLLDSYANFGARARLEGGLAFPASRRVVVPVECALVADLYGHGGFALTLGLSVGAGCIFGRSRSYP